MAEAVGTASAITTFVALALKATILLCQTVESVQARENLIHDLREELQDLSDLLKTLQELTGYTDIDLTALENPLKRYTDACTHFNKLVLDCTKHSSENSYSKRDWLKIRYMGEDISGFRNKLAGYKSTITIAIAYVNLRTTNITKHVLEEYKELIQNTQCDLETHLEDTRMKVDTFSQKEIMSWKIQLLQNLYKLDQQFPISRQGIPLLSDKYSCDEQRFQEEVRGTETLGERVNQPRMNYYEDVSAGDNSHLVVVTTLKDLISAKRIKSGKGSKLVLGQMSDDTMRSFFVNTMGPNIYTNK